MALARKTAPRATDRAKKTPMAVSSESSVRSLTQVMARATRKVKGRANQRGSPRRKSPRATPAKAAWARPSPRKERRLCTTKGEARPERRATRRPATRARWKKG